MANFYDISIALAGVCQTARLVQQFAQKGEASKESFAHSLNSLFVTSPESTLAVYDNNLANLSLGIETLLAQFGGAKGKLDTEIGRYWVSLLALSRKLNQNPQAKNELAQRLAQLERQRALYENNILAEQMIANIAAVYSDIISPLGNQIQVFGPREYLMREDIQNRIRASLLAGIRAGILWQQVGGTRWQFLFSRKAILNQANVFYKSL